MRKWRTAKMIFVILFSLYFYYKSSAEYCFILLGTCVFDYILGLCMGGVMPKYKNVGRFIITLNVVVNVGMLVYFKYFNLLYETFANITNTHFDALDIILPAGISFFTFRSISYIIDIYRGELQPAKNFIEYTFFLTFFPPLLAGPVVRAKDMLPQIKANPQADRAMIGEGLFLIIAGLVKKVIIADYISGNFVDRIFENPQLYSGFENLMGTLGFTLQIYCDFSGYSDMAIGIALLLGYRFKDNFDAPFKSQNPTEFWRRWHISLSSWLRDYVYIPLGGNRKGKARTHINQMTTMVIGGLWHGASWMYLIWGAMQGALLVGHKTIRSFYRIPEKLKGNLIIKTVNILITFSLVVLGFTIFRFAISSPHISESWAGFTAMTSKIMSDFRIEVVPAFYNAYPVIVILIAVGFLMHFLPKKLQCGTIEVFSKLHPFLLTIILAIIIFIVIQVRQSDIVPFVYLQY
ncbi:MAG: MBOAT family protein [Muribaculaceae bacterium]|nr:MBOAT family protein [Muribaculaceae bacterium]